MDKSWIGERVRELKATGNYQGNYAWRFCAKRFKDIYLAEIAKFLKKTT